MCTQNPLTVLYNTYIHSNTLLTLCISLIGYYPENIDYDCTSAVVLYIAELHSPTHSSFVCKHQIQLGNLYG